MANKTSGSAKNPPVAPGDHNFAKVSEVLQESMKKIYASKQKEKKAVQDHVQCHRDDQKRLKSEMKASTEGMEIKDFNLVYNIYARQQDAKLNMEEEDRVRVLDNIAVVFDAAGQGSMIDCIRDMKDEVEKKSKSKKVDVKSPDNLPGKDNAETSEGGEL